MQVYLDVALLLNFLVDWLLLMGANRLSGFPPGIARTAGAAAIGGVYAAVCLLPGFRFLGSFWWQAAAAVGMCITAFGLCRSALRRGVVFVLLSMALGGMALGIGRGDFFSLVAAAAGVCVMCLTGFAGKVWGAAYLPVTLCANGVTLRVTALVDTGNTLRDPISGEAVMVLDADAGFRLAGLTQSQLANPVDTVTQHPGLRLIPYRSVGQPGGMLVAMRLDAVEIGKRKGGTLVAFAPGRLGGDYQALTGGGI